MSLVQALFVVALVGYCVYFALSLRALRRRLVGVESRNALRTRRIWALRTGLLMPAVFLPIYVDLVMGAIKQFGLRRVALPATGAMLLMFVAGLWTGVYIYLMERRYSGSMGGERDSSGM